MNSNDDIDRALSDATDLANRNEFSAALTLLEPLAVSEPNNPRVLVFSPEAISVKADSERYHKLAVRLHRPAFENIN